MRGAQRTGSRMSSPKSLRRRRNWSVMDDVAFGDALGEPPSVTGGLELDEDDLDGQTVLFASPKVRTSANSPMPPVPIQCIQP